MSGLLNFDFETHCYELSAKRKRKQTEEEYEAFTLLMLSCDPRSSYTGPTTSPPTAQNIEDKISERIAALTLKEDKNSTPAIADLASRDDKNATAIVATTNERTATVASSDDKKPMEPFTLANNLLYTCNVCCKSFLSYQELGGHMPRHYDSVIGGDKKGSASSHCNNNAGTPHDFDLNLPAAPEIDVQFLGGHMPRHYDGVIGRGKKSIVITSKSAYKGHMPRHRDSVIGREKKGSASSHWNSNGGTLHDFDLNLPATPEIDVQVLGGHMPRHYDGVIGGGKKSIVITSESALEGQTPSHHDSVIDRDKKGSASSHCNSNGGTPTTST
ncbi:zinc finger protein AZF2-like [Abeliophyllum distichum]|uniref:Zinc finger protein AZF2-like n=1 Tax=Abeliophyllum distichum TaxID=126358 RepID=A0ABD1NTC9_9LAMI